MFQEFYYLVRWCLWKNTQFSLTVTGWHQEGHEAVIFCCNVYDSFQCNPGEVKQSDLYIEQILDVEVEGNRSCSSPKKFWFDTIKDDLRLWNLQAETCQNRCKWRRRLKTASHTHAGHVT